MPSAAFLSQLSCISRSRLLTSTFFTRTCTHTPIKKPLHIIQQTRCLTSNYSNSPDEPQESKSEADVNKPLHTEAALSEEAQEEILDAFDSYIDDIEKEAQNSLNERTSVKDRQLEEAKRKHAERLDILAALPPELMVESVRNKCPGCGTAFQSESVDLPGYLPEGATQEKKEKVLMSLDVDENGEHIPIPVPQKQKDPVCQRCYRLSHYGSIAPHLRVLTKNRASQQLQVPGVDKTQPKSSSGSNTLSPAKFRQCLERLRGINAVVIYLVDIFDFHGTFISSLRNIIGMRNPVILAVNKTDLLPADFKPLRVTNWITAECSAMGLQEVASVHLISSTKGTGVKALLADAIRTAKNRNADVYVIGAANVGKSSFINQLIQMRKKDQARSHDKERRKRKSKQEPNDGAITTSVVPGTTLDVIKIPLGRKISLFDTPGLMMPHQLTNYLDEKELRAVLPTKSVNHVTFRLGEGKALYIGGLARLEVVSGKPFFFTCFFAPTVKLHPGRLDDADEFARKHTGDMLTPPFSPERLDSIGEWTSKSFTAEGDGWKKANVDIVLSGLGWIAVTGPGSVRLRVWVPKGVGVFTREPLMPFEAQTGVSKYTGSAAVNKKQIIKARRRRLANQEY